MLSFSDLQSFKRIRLEEVIKTLEEHAQQGAVIGNSQTVLELFKRATVHSNSLTNEQLHRLSVATDQGAYALRHRPEAALEYLRVRWYLMQEGWLNFT
jgi:hypothetical protein